MYKVAFAARWRLILVLKTTFRILVKEFLRYVLFIQIMGIAMF